MAVTIGIAIATSVPKVISRMTTAAARPTTSDRWLDGFDSFEPT